MSRPLLLLRHPRCGHAVGMANNMPGGRRLLENKREQLRRAGFTGWIVDEEPSPDAAADAFGMPWPSCRHCRRHEMVGTPMLMMGPGRDR